MSKTTCFALACLLLTSWVSGSAADDISQAQMRSLDEQVQAIKSDVLNIAAELGQLEERLLYPSGTQFAVFVALAEGDEVRLDAVEVEVNGELVAHYIYSFKELEALQQGGVQRLYTGNIPTGEHSMNVTWRGKLHDGDEISRSQQFAFVKDVEPKMLGLTISASTTGQGSIQLGDW